MKTERKHDFRDSSKTDRSLDIRSLDIRSLDIRSLDIDLKIDEFFEISLLLFTFVCLHTE